MTDQAYRLRKLMIAGAEVPLRPSPGAPRMLAVAGAKGGVGTTTVAVNLAVAMAREGRRVVLVDGDTHRPDVAAQCGLADGSCLDDVLSGRRTLHEAMRLGPGGVQILPGRWGSAAAAEWSPRSQERLLRDLLGLGLHADCLLVDVGASADAVARSFWQAAESVLLVATPDNVAVMDAYAAIKSQCETSTERSIALLLNQVTDAARADDAQARVLRACRRFLGIEVRALSPVPFDQAMLAAASSARPLLVHSPHSPAAVGLARAADELSRPVHRERVHLPAPTPQPALQGEH